MLLLLLALFFVRHFWAGNKMANVCLQSITGERGGPKKYATHLLFSHVLTGKPQQQQKKQQQLQQLVL